MFEDYFDGTPGGGWTWEDIENFGRELDYAAPWEVAAAQDLIAITLSDPQIFSLLDTYFTVEQPSEQLTNAVLNTAAQLALNNANAGAYDGWVDQFEWASSRAQAWQDANGFADIYLDWNYYGGGGGAMRDYMGLVQQNWVADQGGLY